MAICYSSNRKLIHAPIPPDHQCNLVYMGVTFQIFYTHMGFLKILTSMKSYYTSSFIIYFFSVNNLHFSILVNFLSLLKARPYVIDPKMSTIGTVKPSVKTRIAHCVYLQWLSKIFNLGSPLPMLLPAEDFRTEVLWNVLLSRFVWFLLCGGV